jgi:hypothetical protein
MKINIYKIVMNFLEIQTNNMPLISIKIEIKIIEIEILITIIEMI